MEPERPLDRRILRSGGQRYDEGDLLRGQSRFTSPHATPTPASNADPRDHDERASSASQTRPGPDPDRLRRVLAIAHGLFGGENGSIRPASHLPIVVAW